MREARSAATSAKLIALRMLPTCYKNVWHFELGIRFLCCKFLEITTLAYFYMVRTQMAVSNLSPIPDDLPSKWDHSLSAVYLEHCVFTKFPSPLTYLYVQEISLSGNPISSMASVKFGREFNLLTTLVLASMPLHDLPSMAPKNTENTEWVSIENTQILEFSF